MTTLRGVTIGDKFMRDGREHTVVDFYTTTNLKGEVVGQECIVEYKFATQLMRKDVAFSTVIQNKI